MICCMILNNLSISGYIVLMAHGVLRMRPAKWNFSNHTGTLSGMPMSIRCPEENITWESFTIQWDQVHEDYPIVYVVNWTDNKINNAAITSNTSYMVTGLSANTTYFVTVTLIDTSRAGVFEHSNVVEVKTIKTTGKYMWCYLFVLVLYIQFTNSN